MTIAIDKQAHFWAGMALCGAVWPFGIAPALGCVLIAAVGKEIYDYFHQDTHTPEVMDAVATCLGGVAGAAWQLLVGCYV